MQIGIVGLGRMGANIARRLMRSGHACVVHDRDPAPGRQLAGEGAVAVRVSAIWSRPSARRAWCGSCCRPGRLPRPRSASLASCSRRRHHHRWRQHLLEGRHPPRPRAGRKGIHYLDVGTSGGVWGLERGYCLMIGGEKAVVERLDPIFAALAPGRATIPATAARKGRDPRAEQGYLHAGPSGAGHFVKMIHNGIEYGMMQAIAEGFDILKNAGSQRLPEELRLTIDVADIAEVWRRGSVVTSWLLDLTAAALAEDRDACGLLGARRGFRRGTLDRAGRDRGGGAGRGADRRALHPLPLAPGPHLRREGALRHAQGLRRACRAGQERE